MDFAKIRITGVTADELRAGAMQDLPRERFRNINIVDCDGGRLLAQNMRLVAGKHDEELEIVLSRASFTLTTRNELEQACMAENPVRETDGVIRLVVPHTGFFMATEIWDANANKMYGVTRICLAGDCVGSEWTLTLQLSSDSFEIDESQGKAEPNDTSTTAAT